MLDLDFLLIHLGSEAHSDHLQLSSLVEVQYLQGSLLALKLITTRAFFGQRHVFLCFMFVLPDCYC